MRKQRLCNGVSRVIETRYKYYIKSKGEIKLIVRRERYYKGG